MKASARSADQGVGPDDVAKAPKHDPRQRLRCPGQRLRRPEQRRPDAANGKGSDGTYEGYGESARRYGRRSP